MANSEVFVVCPLREQGCNIDTCPRYLQGVEIIASPSGGRTANGFCHQNGNRFVRDVTEEYFMTREKVAVYDYFERDAREEVSRIDKIRRMLEKDFFYVVREAEPGKPVGSDEVLFDTIAEAIECDIRRMAKSEIPTPRVYAAWQKVLPEMLSFPTDEAVYYLEKDLAEHPEAVEKTLPDESVVYVNYYPRPHPLASHIERVRTCVRTYLEEGVRLSRLCSSTSADLWVKALGDYRSVEHGWTLPESRPILDGMADTIIEAAKRLSIDLSLPNLTQATRDKQTAKAVATELKPELKEIKGIVAGIKRVVDSIASFLKIVFLKLPKWFSPRKEVKREDVQEAFKLAHRYECLANVKEPHKTQIKAVIDYTYSHPIVQKKSRKFGKDELSLSEAVRAVLVENVDKWKLIPGTWTEFEPFKAACYEHRGKDNDPYNYAK